MRFWAGSKETCVLKVQRELYHFRGFKANWVFVVATVSKSDFSYCLRLFYRGLIFVYHFSKIIYPLTPTAL